MQIAVFIVVAAVVIAFIIWQSKLAAERERARRAALAEFAASNGMSFSVTDPLNLDSRYNGVNDIGRGHARYAEDVLNLSQPMLTAFRYHYKTWETRTVTRNGRTHTEQYEKTHWRQYLIIELNSQFPALSLRSENLFDKLACFVGFDDIDFESEEFSKKYFCKSASKEFAYAVMHPQMMEYLMNLALPVEFNGGLLLMDLGRYKFDAPGLANAVNVVAGMVNRIPDFVWQDYGKAVPVKLTQVVYASPVVTNA